ncbi:hypothetical protein RJ640_008165 [Escallonia rubra]|uniref:65-kDa microtubule-associated protein 5 n=1 Tax=Escallonia rubra TaxID=112253 RepID=A0AA88QZG9_9ASTE|nr:hypothetical protein RJ640_008165 [Escallonia rubra]
MEIQISSEFSFTSSLHMKIWDEIGENDSERDKMLLQLEQECLDIYRRKVETTRKYKADLHQSLVEAEAEVASLVSTLGERASFPNYEKVKSSLKQQISAISPVLDDLRWKKQERIKQFSETQLQIVRICAEIAGNDQSINSADLQVNEQDLTTRKLGEMKSHLQELQSEKTLRLQKVNSHIKTLHELSVVMSFDFNKIVIEVHPSLVDPVNAHSKSISNETLARLTGEVQSLKQVKQQRLQKVLLGEWNQKTDYHGRTVSPAGPLQGLGGTLIELWDLMETSVQEQKRFEYITSLISLSVDEVSRHGCLALDVIQQTEVEVERLNVLKASKMKELVFKRQNELEEIYRGVHMDVDSDTARQILISLIDSGNVALSDLLSSMDDQIAKAKEQALSRKDILDKVEKWRHASEEEIWLDEYERDENRYSAGRGVHKSLKRAEKARILAPLLQTLEEYIVLRREKEEEKRRSREQKRLQEQLFTEQEALFGSRPAIKKPLGQSTTNTTAGTPLRRTGTPAARHGVSGGKERRDSGKCSGDADDRMDGVAISTIPLDHAMAYGIFNTVLLATYVAVLPY